MKPVRFTLVGKDGNALALIGAWRAAAREQGWPDAEIERVSHEALSKDYRHVLATLQDHSESEG
jgi:hypothetical protein